MALRTLHIRITHDDQVTAAKGKVVFRSDDALRDSAGNLIHGPVYKVAKLAAGEATVQLPACDDPAYSPSGWTYTVTVDTDAWQDRFQLSIPSAGSGTLEFADLAPATTPTTVATYSLLGHTHDNVSDHGGLTGLADDDHPQYLTNARGDLRYQPLDGDLTAIAALAPANDDIVQRKAGAWTNRTLAQLKTDLAITKTDVGLGNADNTSDAAKPISTATQTALDGKATKPAVRRATITSGNIPIPDTGGFPGSNWTILTAAGELVVPAAVGDHIEVNYNGLREGYTEWGMDLAVVKGSGPTTIQRYLSSDSGTPSAAGDPGQYPGDASFQPHAGALDLVVEAADRDGANVRIAIVVVSSAVGTRTLRATPSYPFRWWTKNNGPYL